MALHTLLIMQASYLLAWFVLPPPRVHSGEPSHLTLKPITSDSLFSYGERTPELRDYIGDLHSENAIASIQVSQSDVLPCHRKER